MAVYFKFSSWNHNNYDTVALENPFISTTDLKEEIRQKKKLTADTGLEFVNAQNGEEYHDGTNIPKNTSVIVKLVPQSIFSQINVSNKPVAATTILSKPVAQNTDGFTNNNTNTTEEDDFGPELWQNIANEEANEEEMKMMEVVDAAANIPTVNTVGLTHSGKVANQPFIHKRTLPVDPNLPKKIPPPGYVCYRCSTPGHFIYDCPTNGDPNFNFVRRPTTMHGVPKSFLHQREGHPDSFEFVPNEGDFTKLINQSAFTGGFDLKDVPQDLICPLCRKMMENAVLASCCMESACDQCIRSTLTEKNDFLCPLCNNPCVPDELLPNKALRRAVDTFKANKSNEPQPQQHQPGVTRNVGDVISGSSAPVGGPGIPKPESSPPRLPNPDSSVSVSENAFSKTEDLAESSLQEGGTKTEEAQAPQPTDPTLETDLTIPPLDGQVPENSIPVLPPGSFPQPQAMQMQRPRKRRRNEYPPQYLPPHLQQQYPYGLPYPPDMNGNGHPPRNFGRRRPTQHYPPFPASSFPPPLNPVPLSKEEFEAQQEMMRREYKGREGNDDIKREKSRGRSPNRDEKHSSSRYRSERRRRDSPERRDDSHHKKHHNHRHGRSRSRSGSRHRHRHEKNFSESRNRGKDFDKKKSKEKDKEKRKSREERSKKYDDEKRGKEKRPKERSSSSKDKDRKDEWKKDHRRHRR